MIDLNLNVVHWFVIKVYDKRGACGKLIEFHRWDRLSFELRNKYDWYFKYRAALAQVKYPKYIVDVFWGNEPAKGKDLKAILKKGLAAKKANITKNKNKLDSFKIEFEKFKKAYCKLFCIEKDLEYKSFLAKIKLAEAKILTLELELLTIKNNKKHENFIID